MTQKDMPAHGTGYLAPLIRGRFLENQMDWSETMRKAAILAEAKGYITFDELNQIIPPKPQSEDIESLVSALSDKGIWVQEE
jgi:Sigma-70 factor, region 1.1